MWWWVGLFVFLMVLDWLSKTPAVGVPLLLALLAAIIYGIYCWILSSDWVDRIHRDHKYQLEAKQREERERLIRQDWDTTTYQLPTEDQFCDAVTARYKEGKTRYLREQFLSSIEFVQGRIYTNSGISEKEHSVAETIRFHDQLMGAALQGLDRFTRAAPDAVLTTAAEENAHSYLMLKRTLPQLLNTDDPAETLLDAYWELAQPMEDALVDLQTYRLFHNQSFGPDPLPNEPASIDDRMWDVEKTGKEPNVESIRKQYERDKEKYDKATKERDDELPPIARAVRGTPYWDYKTQLLPNEIYQDAFELPLATRFAGTWIIAPSGQGKTNLMWHLIAADRKRRTTVVIMDSKGTLLNSYRGYDDAVLIDDSVRINPFQIGRGDQSIDFIEYIFSLISLTMTEKQRSLFYPVLRLVTKVPDGSLATFKRILILGWRELDLGKYIEHCDLTTRDFFTLGKPAAFDDPKYKETKQELIWRFDLLLSKPAMQNIFSATHTNIDFFQLLDSGKTILINNNTNDLGVQGAEFFGRFFLALTWMHGITRTDIPDDKKMPIYFYIDEAQTVIAKDEKFPMILDELRSQQIALTIAHQRLNRITSKEVLDALYNCPVRFASVDGDRAAIAHQFNLPADALKLPPHTFACYVRGKTDHAHIFKIPFFDMSQFPPPREPVPTLEPEPVAAPKPVPEPAVAAPSPPPEKQARKKGR